MLSDILRIPGWVLARETLLNRLLHIALYGFSDDGQPEMVKLLLVALKRLIENET